MQLDAVKQWRREGYQSRQIPVLQNIFVILAFSQPYPYSLSLSISYFYLGLTKHFEKIKSNSTYLKA